MASTDADGATGEAKRPIIGLATALSVVLASQDVAGPDRRAGRRVTSVSLAALLWSSRQLKLMSSSMSRTPPVLRTWPCAERCGG